MRKLGNTLYITSQGTHLSQEGDCVLVKREDGAKTRVPLHGVDGIICFGQVSCTPFLLGHGTGMGVTISFFSRNGRFLARVEGPVSGNVRLRRAQYRITDDAARCAALVRDLVSGKVHNQRNVLRRAVRDHGADPDGRLSEGIERLDSILRSLRGDETSDTDRLRGWEGEAAQAYFAAFPALLRQEGFVFPGRRRRPPPDPVNALLSFFYVLLTHDVRSALEAVGLDPAVGFLHRERPGRPGLALDLVEEFRAWMADRLALNLINRGQLQPKDFTSTETGAVSLSDEARRIVLVAYQERKREELHHPFTGDTVSVGLLWHVQARLLAAHLRGELDAYPPFLAR
ncbi:MAG: type I-C CRISPR-associated endonuclease Cas1c [Rhodospirillales bacterium]|nr:type I-C CRISPR-associated endonuclease Cas1c [Rhodospirillales bacterium]